jgi:hypothetical protein
MGSNLGSTVRNNAFAARVQALQALRSSPDRAAARRQLRRAPAYSSNC